MLTCTFTSFVDTFMLGMVVGIVGLIAGIFIFFNNDYDRKTKSDKGRMHG